MVTKQMKSHTEFVIGHKECAGPENHDPWFEDITRFPEDVDYRIYRCPVCRMEVTLHIRGYTKRNEPTV